MVVGHEGNQGQAQRSTAPGVQHGHGLFRPRNTCLCVSKPCRCSLGPLVASTLGPLLPAVATCCVCVWVQPKVESKPVDNLFEAAKAGDAKAALQLLKAGADVNAVVSAPAAQPIRLLALFCACTSVFRGV
jgi:hypothetical protein